MQQGLLGWQVIEADKANMQAPSGQFEVESDSCKQGLEMVNGTRQSQLAARFAIRAQAVHSPSCPRVASESKSCSCVQRMRKSSGNRSG